MMSKMSKLKLILTFVMGVCIVVIASIGSETAGDGLKAGLLAFMAAATLLVGQLPTQGRARKALDFATKILTGSAAVLSAIHWIESEADGEVHIVVDTLTWVTSAVILVAIIALIYKGNPESE